MADTGIPPNWPLNDRIDGTIFVYLIKRLLLLIPTLIGAVTLTFIATQLVPGGSVEQMMMKMKRRGDGDEASGGGAPDYRGCRGVGAERIKEVRALYGFDKSPFEHYFLVLGCFAHFDLGENCLQHCSVWDLIKPRLPVSISIGLWTLLLTYFIVVPFGITKAVRTGSRFDLVTDIIVLIGYAIPGFVLGVLLPMFFDGGTFFQWFPVRSITSDNWDQLNLPNKITDYLWHIMLPVMTLMVGSFTVITMLTRNASLEEIRKQYVLTACNKGPSEWCVLWKHISRNALLPLVTGFPSTFIGTFFTGSLSIERLSSLDDMGLFSYEAVMRHDYPVALGTLCLFTSIGLAVRLISDVCYVLADPRAYFGSVG